MNKVKVEFLPDKVVRKILLDAGLDAEQRIKVRKGLLDAGVAERKIYMGEKAYYIKKHAGREYLVDVGQADQK